MPGPKLNEYPVRRPGAARLPVTAEQPPSTRARARYVRVSPYKVREVLDLIRGQEAERAQDILRFCERDAAGVVAKVLGSALANAEHNLQQLPDELYVSSCFADEGPTLKRWRPRARGRATRIRKRTSHVTVVVSRLPDVELGRRRTRSSAAAAERRRRREGQRAATTRRRRARPEAAPAAEEGPEVPEAEESVHAATDAVQAATGAAAPETVAEATPDDLGEPTDGTDELTLGEPLAGGVVQDSAPEVSEDQPRQGTDDQARDRPGQQEG